MVKQVSVIPMVNNGKPSQRELIRKDIQNAMKEHIEQFEFVGDEYNYKYLGQYAREEAVRVTKRFFREKLKEIEEEHGWTHLTLPHEYERNRFIKITTRGERVFCIIDYSCVGKLVKMTEEKYLREEQKNANSKRVSRKVKDPRTDNEGN